MPSTAIVPVDTPPNIQNLDICPTAEILARRQSLMAELGAALRTLKYNILDVGRILDELRQVTPYGEWEKVLENICADFDISRSSAHNYMRAHEQIKSLPVEVVTACRESKFNISSKPKLDAIVKAFVENPDATPSKIVGLAVENIAIEAEIPTSKPDDAPQQSPPANEPMSIELDIEAAILALPDSPELNDAVEHPIEHPAINKFQPAKTDAKTESQLKKMQREWATVTNSSVGRITVTASNVDSDVEIAAGRYDLLLSGVKPAMMNKIRELLLCK